MSTIVEQPNTQAVNTMDGSTQNDDPPPSDIQSYLMMNYREALKRGDQTTAKSCILAIRYFSAYDPNATSEISSVAKSDSDVSEAAKCFANIFNELYISINQNPSKSTPNESLVANQIKNETRVLLSELRFHYLKLKSVAAPAAIPSRQSLSVNASPLLSPRMRLSSEDRIASRESLSKLDSHLYAKTRSYFYQQLFDNLPEETKNNILNDAIENCDNPYEACRLMMLNISIFESNVKSLSEKLLRTLIDLSDAKDRVESSIQSTGSTTPRSFQKSRYAKSLLVLDAIPLIMQSQEIPDFGVPLEELVDRSLNFYSDHCLEAYANEHDPSELHEGVRRSITARILGTEQSSSYDDVTSEYNVISTLDTLYQQLISCVPEAHKREYEHVRNYIDNQGGDSPKLGSILDIIKRMNLDEDMPDDLLFGQKESGSSSQSTATPPPKGRGRPKKVQQSVSTSLDDKAKNMLLARAREVRIAFYLLVRHMLVNCAHYLKGTKSRMLMNFDNPLAAQLKIETVKSSNQRTSRSKASSSQSSESSGSQAKKMKLDKEPTRLHPGPAFETSPLNSEQSRKLDSSILSNLVEAYGCYEFLESNNGVFNKLWRKFTSSSSITKSNWYRRFMIDGMLLTKKFDDLSEMIDSIFSEIEDIEAENKKNQAMDLIDSSSASVSYIRILTQSISCEVQRCDKEKTYDTIVELLPRMKRCGLLAHDEDYSNGNSIEEYIILIRRDGDENMGFLFFDSLSIMRYCIDILMSILKQYISGTNPSIDSIVGHSIVLSQIDWPKHYHIYHQCMQWIRINKPKSTTPQGLSASTKFTYLDFFSYIKNPNIIEDFMAMLIQGYTLDIKNPHAPLALSNSQARGAIISQGATGGSKATSTNSSTRSGKAITTRGVNKSFKEDLKIALVTQMKSSSVLIPLDIISDFIQESLIPSLVSIK